MDTNGNIDQKIMEEIIKAIQQIGYGELVITIHNSKIVQIEKREKRRFREKGGDA
ncbi:YezD family protein [Thermodesulfovibrionales bacterium]|nr:YezD family protein [Thermodesulfovibrionales bacterium]MCL0085572.1 YezD family protein [Thermodesulfovibrionales bacterium]